MRILNVASDQGTEEYLLPSRKDLRLGSAPDNDIVLGVRGVSRHHARLCLDSATPRLIDLGSRNGLVVDGARRHEVPLRPGKVIRMGRALVFLGEASTSDAEIGLRLDDSWSATDVSSRTTESVTAALTASSAEAALHLVRRFQTKALTGEIRQSFLEGARGVLGARAVLRFQADVKGLDRLAVEDVAGPLPRTHLWSEISLVEHGEARTLSSGQTCFVITTDSTGARPAVAALWDDSAKIPEWKSDFLAFLVDRLGDDSADEHDDIDGAAADEGELKPPEDMVLGDSPASRELLDQIRVSLDWGDDVLLQGETGTGKELFARLIHRSGPTAGGPFVAVNCAAIPSDLLESELFGVARRVATGVDPRLGLFELAAGGTLLLDEISELALPLQSKLLRALEEREIRPLGAPQVKPVNVRIISTANVRLKERVDSGAFRADLYYRLDQLRFEIPPLRQRREDIPGLALTFVRHWSRRYRRRFRGISVRAFEILTSYDWPGNVRELRAVLKRAVLSCRGQILKSTYLYELAATKAAPLPESSSLKEKLEAKERKEIIHALRRAGGSRTAAARELKISRQGLFKKMRRLGIR